MAESKSRLGWDRDKPLKEKEVAQCQTQGSPPCENLVSWAGGDLDPGQVEGVKLTCAAGHEHAYWVIKEDVGWEDTMPLSKGQSTRCSRRLEDAILCDERVLFTGKKTRGALRAEGAAKPGDAISLALTCSDNHTDWYHGVMPDG